MKIWSAIFLSMLLVGFVTAQPPNPKSQSTTAAPLPKPVSPPDTPGEEPEETIKIDSTLVSIPVTVLDPEGRYLLKLTPQDFRLWEEDTEQEITNFSSIEVPVNIVLMIDTSRSTKFKIEDIQRAATTFIEQLRPADRVMIVSFDDKTRVPSDFTSDRHTLKTAIAKTKTGTGTKLYEAVNFVLNQKLATIQGRKAIVLFTDGVDTESKYGAGKQSMFDVEKSEVMVYSIQYNTISDVAAMRNDNQPQQLVSSQPTTEEFLLATRYLRGLALRSGGRLHPAETLSNVHEAFALIAEELRHQYALGYYPSQEGKVGEFRRVRVEVLPPHRSVRARDGYRVGK